MDFLAFDTGTNQVWVTLNIQTNLESMDALIQRTQDTTLLQKKVGWMIRRAFANRFSEGGPGWKPLEMSTVMSKMDAQLPPVGKSGKVFPRLRQIGVAPAESVLIGSGWLRDSYVRKFHPDHISRVEETEDGLRIIEGSKDPKAVYHQQGTSPYMIAAVNAKALRFMSGSGSIVFRSVVNHPGLPARPVEVTTQEEREIGETIREYLEGTTTHHE